MEIVKAPFNYIGNKHRIIKELLALFPDNINTFVDLFCGGGDVFANVEAERILANDINFYLINIFQTFQTLGIDKSIQYIDDVIEQWKLSKENQEAYLSFREYYNRTRSPLDLYVLMCYSFNYQFRFNSNHEFNTPFGRNRSSFNDSMRKNLRAFVPRLERIEFSSKDFSELDLSLLADGDLIYADPPYRLSIGSYNDGKRGFKGWSMSDDIELLYLLDTLSGKGVRFALSNVMSHKGIFNSLLYEWVGHNGYHIHYVHVDYSNCNYHVKHLEQTQEVLITNYMLG